LDRDPVDANPPACIHPDAVGRPGEALTPSPDAEGRVRLRDAGLGVIEDGSSYTLSTGAPPAVGPVSSYQLTGDYADPYLQESTMPMLAANPMSDRIPFLGPASGRVAATFTGNDFSAETDGSCPPIRAGADRQNTAPLITGDDEATGALTSPYDPKPDGPRYAAMGDAVTVPVIHWIGTRLLAAYEFEAGA
jgi:hypothetical protein